MKPLKRIVPHITSLIPVAFFGLLLLFPMDHAQAQTATRILVFGDSLTSGYQLRPEEAFAPRLERKLRQLGYDNIEVSDMSDAGDTTTTAVERVHQALTRQPDIVLLCVGMNDILRGINVPVIYNNYTKLLEALVRQQKAYVIFMGVKAPPGVPYSYGKQMEAVYKQLVDLYHPVFYPDTLAGVAGKADLNLADGLHPNARGVDVMVENIYRDVDAALRWKWENDQYNQQYRQQLELNGASSAAPTTLVAPSGVAPTPISPPPGSSSRKP